VVRLLVAASFVWPMFLGSAVHGGTRSAVPALAAAAYLAGARVCHQRPERSFHTSGTKWPVCARCSGLYLGAPFGALAAFLASRRRPARARLMPWLAVAAVPTALTMALEWTGAMPVANLARCVAAMPLGALVAVVIIRTAGGRS